ncbi:hypothetical protein VNO77_34742 [Canavalia gladiata]|uniref:Uncharacterized protein n=1 Tax=Canavalia gladiata TaxID=3824 RepID=A0AAN9PZE7_CANGL
MVGSKRHPGAGLNVKVRISSKETCAWEDPEIYVMQWPFPKVISRTESGATFVLRSEIILRLAQLYQSSLLPEFLEGLASECSSDLPGAGLDLEAVNQPITLGLVITVFLTIEPKHMALQLIHIYAINLQEYGYNSALNWNFLLAESEFTTEKWRTEISRRRERKRENGERFLLQILER